MPPLLSYSKAFGRLLSSSQRALVAQNGFGSLGKVLEGGGQPSRFMDVRCLNGIARIGSPAVDRPIDGDKEVCFSNGLVRNASQMRRFLGCGDGEEGNVLSRNYEERRAIGYSPDQLFAVVAAVDLYEEFVPWCQRSEVIRRNPDGSFDAELEIGFKFLVESYVSHVELTKPKSIKTTVSDSGLFDHLINIWEFNPGPIPGSCDLHFLVDFKFQSPLYRQVASMFFKEVVSQLVGSFTDRCRRIYGPGVRVLEDSYGQRV
ncbi:hypothetical protein QJS04_geneDACA009453 [Acorus gramineus]|uniref:Coenzyme Q-binding protein COQ10 START domain-containing protein n=1 Tax=Acorus gramineus TaxID=55184 RepID=A0AAV9AJG8_ACOGR|nr:hypothetical protein QJS04_geneDACA009453 [Acorus gramineus]